MSPDPIQWTDAARRKVYAAREAQPKKRAKVDASAVRKRFEALIASHDRSLDYFVRHEHPDPELAELTKRALATSRKIDPRAKLDAEVEAAAAVISGLGRRRVGAAAAEKAFVDRWALDGGLAFTVEALTRTMGFEAKHEHSHLVRRAPPDWSFDMGPWTLLRGHLNAADDAAYAEARAAALRIREGCPAGVACAISHAFSTEAEWAADDARRVLAMRNPLGYHPYYSAHLLATLRDVAPAREICAAHPTEAAEYAMTLLHRLGLGAIEPLRVLLQAESRGDVSRMAAAEALALVEDDAAAALLAPLIGEPELRALVQGYFTRAPQLARRALQDLAQRKSKAGSAAAALLKKLKVEAGRAAAEAAPAAPLLALPAILTTPPWAAPAKPAATSDKKAAAAKGAAGKPPLELLPYAERLVFDAADAKRLSTLRKERDEYVAAGRGRETKSEAELEADLRGNTEEHGNSTLSLWELSPARARAVWNDAVVDHWWLSSEEDGLEVLDALGVEAVPTLARFALEHRCRAAILPALTRADSPHAAVAFAEALGSKNNLARARAWLENHPEAAAIGLVPAALAGSKSAAKALDELGAMGHGAVVASVSARYGVAPAAGGSAVHGFPAAAKPPRLPRFFNVTVLPAVRLASGGELPREAAETLGRLLVLAPPERTPAGLAAVRDACERASLAAFAAAVAQAWLDDDAPPGEAWALRALGHLGDDAAAVWLASQLPDWARSAHARAAVGLSTLALLGTTRALVELNRIAERTPFPAFGKKAREAIASVAAARGMEAEELADWLVPELGLDRAGATALPVRGERFTVGFDEELRPFVVGPDGERRGDLPKPRSGSREDQESVETWNALKREVKKIGPERRRRLERAMIDGRRFPLGTFRGAFVEHPLLVHLVRRLVWSGHEGDGGPRTFRVAEDGTLADVDDRPLALPETASVGLPHPAELGAALSLRWKKVLDDYRILQPFPQLDRPIFTLTEPERASSRLTRFQARVVPLTKILALERLGWRKVDHRGRFVDALARDLPGQRSAVLHFSPGLDRSELAESGDQTIGACELDDGAALGALGPVLTSELLRDLGSML